MIAKHKIMNTEYHSLYAKRISTIKTERYNHKTEEYESLSGYDKKIFQLDKFLKRRKFLHALVFNRLFFWKKPIFKVSGVSYKRYRLYVGNFENNRKDLHSLFYQLREASSKDTLELIIGSNGGSVTEGQQLFNLIKEKFHERTTAYLDNHGYSMGAILFCMVEKRVIYPYSALMFHNYSLLARGKGGDIKTKMEHTDKHLTKFIHDMVVKQGFLTQEELEHLLIGKDFWMDCQELCRRGIATHVMVNGEEIEADMYLEELERG